jgi:colicin import membrane protein
MKKGEKIIPDDKKFLLWLVTAAITHILVFILALSYQLWDAGRTRKPAKIVRVTLVSLPGTGGVAGLSGGEGAALSRPAAKPKQLPSPPSLPAPPAPPIPPKVKAAAKVQVKEPVAPQPPPKPVPSTVKKVSEVKPDTKPVRKQEDINKALDRLKQAVDKKSTSSPQPTSAGNLNKALQQLQLKVKGEGASGGTGMSGGSGSSTGGKAGDGGRGGGGGPYKAVIASIIQQNWEFSRQMLRSSYGMEVYVRINIYADGTIRQILFDRRAPSEYLNSSVKKAIEKSSPLPPFPKEEGDRSIWIGFVFTPEGIEK